ncbi:hypothetical protein VaNZ11_002317 [Volvox africanus]|uniref:Sulfotransferase n=1 Tax=Volvox africanus TaxID=51714 RepID=A0ABQ5RSK2_9CHLO|nr:hypothetical protein VaNZ11_002317 [Volvox africanus]
MRAHIPFVIVTILVAYGSISLGITNDEVIGLRPNKIAAGAASRRVIAQLPESDEVASILQGAILKSFVGWSIMGDTAPLKDQDGAEYDEEASEQKLLSQMKQLLLMVGNLLRPDKGCRGKMGSDMRILSRSAACPAAAPELRQGSTSSFLDSILQTYPGGPTDREALIAWAAAATAFLEEHRRLQRQHRKIAQRQGMDPAAAALAQQNAAPVGTAAEGTAASSPAPAKANPVAMTATGPSTAEAFHTKSSAHNPPAGASAKPTSMLAGSLEETADMPRPSLSGDHQQGMQQHRQQRRRQRQRCRRHLLEASSGDGTAWPGEGRGDDDSRLSRIVMFRGRDLTTAARGRHAHDAPFSTAGKRRRLKEPGVTDGSAQNVTHHMSATATASTVGGLPLVRRVLLAQLLLGWATELRRELPPTPEVATAVAQVLAKLYYIHVDSVVDRAALEYFHISKAGGTSWTAAAKANGCSVPRARAARTPEFDDDCRWFDPEVLVQMGHTEVQAARTFVCPRYGIIERRSPVRDCSRRLDHFRRTGLQYTANEYTLHGGRDDMYGTHICPQFVTVATIREPLGRLVSNIRYMMVQMKRDKAMSVETFSKHFCNRSAADWEVYSPPVADNYNIRTLVGERAFHSRLYEIGEAHETVAKQLLMQFDLLLDLNAGDKAALLLMRAGLGWNTTLANVHIWSSEKLAKKGSLDFNTCRMGDLELLLARQVYDQRWYSFGHALSHLDQLFLSTAVQLGLQPWPEDWQERQLGPIPEDGVVHSKCGLVGLVPPQQHPHRPAPAIANLHQRSPPPGQPI